MSALLAGRGIGHAVIGAAALAAHGVARATLDVDLLATDSSCLDEAIWVDLRAEGASVEIRPGDESDPLGGVVRIRTKGGLPIDLIVGKLAWQAELIHRATPLSIEGVAIPVVEGADLVLLKLYAGGSQDAWDIEQLLDLEPTLVEDVEARLPALPAECASLWRRIVTERGSSR